jgi:hypothetical protein
MLRIKFIQIYINNKFERDLSYIKTGLKEDEEFAKDVYRALCNMRWRMKRTPFKYSCSWRYAGGLIAQLREQGEDYIDFYCSGNEGIVAPNVKEIFYNLGWIPSPWPKDRAITLRVMHILKDWFNSSGKN